MTDSTSSAFVDQVKRALGYLEEEEKQPREDATTSKSSAFVSKLKRTLDYADAEVKRLKKEDPNIMFVANFGNMFVANFGNTSTIHGMVGKNRSIIVPESVFNLHLKTVMVDEYVPPQGSAANREEWLSKALAAFRYFDEDDFDKESDDIDESVVRIVRRRMV